MDDKPVIYVTGVCCSGEEENKNNSWYNNVHIPMLMEYEGLNGAERYHILHGTPYYPNLIAIYHYRNLNYLESQWTAPFYLAVAANIKDTWPNGRDVRWRGKYLEHRKWSADGAKALGEGSVIHIVGVNGPGQAVDKEFNEWYDNTHVPWLMKSGTIAQAVRYRIIEPNKDYPAYLAVYYFEDRANYEEFTDHPERVAAVKELNEHWPNGIGSVWRVQYQLLKAWKK